MITAEMVHNLSLKRAFRGYEIRGVDDFLELVEQQLAQDVQSMEALRRDLAQTSAEKEDLRQQLQALTAAQADAAAAQRESQREVDRLRRLVEQYQQDSTRLEASLVDIYHMRETVLRDAAAQADETRRAAEAALAQAQCRADQIMLEARAYKAEMDRECELLYQKISDFRTTALEIDRRQVEAIKVFPKPRPVYEISGEVAVARDADSEDVVVY